MTLTIAQDSVCCLCVWKLTNRKIHHEMPTELSGLRLGEKLLHQKAAAFVPLHHAWKDRVSVKGHVCSFLQAVNEVVTVLPCLPDNVNVV